ncbi:Iron complex transport system substrate-binding protein [Candidatus Desulfarcum epimagneticum]|uniref:Iron complex transport system substrate-binding protein n=1 Tax=uncultured Desulfobacteraceae bacterium TaxID=218296 RepID=A0A484HNU6_9BACT|nr:Iron complex transport system substrate-binding protein [uncultured Desulfobacteraceae bacterium]
MRINQTRRAAAVFFVFFSVLFLLWRGAARSADMEARKIVSLGPVITKMIYMLGAQDRLIANTVYCVAPEEAREKKKIGTVMQADIEKIISLAPDLVIASSLAREKQLDILRRHGVRAIRLQNPKGFSEICDMTARLGKIVGQTERAAEIIAGARRQVEAAIRRTRGLKKRTVFMQIGLKPLRAASKDAFIHDYIVLSSGVNIAENETSGVYSREKVLQEDPDVILIATMGTSKKAGEMEKKRWAAFSSLKAARNGEIHVLDPEIVCSPTPPIFAQGLEEIASLIHPGIGVFKKRPQAFGDGSP